MTVFSADIRRWLFQAALVVLGGFGVLLVQLLWQRVLVCDPTLELLSPAVACSANQGRSEWDYDPLRETLVAKIAAYETSGSVPDIALYFRDLKNGHRFGIREDEIFSPASLLKVPIMMVILHEADRNPAFLDEEIPYEKEYGKDFIFGSPESALKLHASYTVRELLENMIRRSDNASSYLLLDRINALGLRENSNAFADLGTMQLLLSGELDNTRLISLVNIFVALYNANYLSPRSSQYALELLSQSSFDRGIVAGVPQDVRVAHKFGIRPGSARLGDAHELHDCGVVYHPSTPYVLCVLTSGAGEDVASTAIEDLSRTVYQAVGSLQP